MKCNLCNADYEMLCFWSPVTFGYCNNVNTNKGNSLLWTLRNVRSISPTNQKKTTSKMVTSHANFSSFRGYNFSFRVLDFSTSLDSLSLDAASIEN